MRFLSLTVAWWLLAVTGAAKLVSLIPAKAFVLPTGGVDDPLLGLTAKESYAVGALCEVVLCVLLKVVKIDVARGIMLTAAGVTFMVYHYTKLMAGIISVCPCLGAFGRHVPRLAELLSLLMATYLAMTGLRLWRDALKS